MDPTDPLRSAKQTVALEVLVIAHQHQNNEAAMGTSARLCYEEALDAYVAKDYQRSYLRALRSLEYSIGILHPDYRRAFAYPGSRS